jgi:TatD DNase family protein
MKIIDSHCHLDRVDLSAFGGSMESLLAHGVWIIIGLPD